MCKIWSAFGLLLPLSPAPLLNNQSFQAGCIKLTTLMIKRDQKVAAGRLDEGLNRQGLTHVIYSSSERGQLAKKRIFKEKQNNKCFIYTTDMKS